MKSIGIALKKPDNKFPLPLLSYFAAGWRGPNRFPEKKVEDQSFLVELHVNIWKCKSSLFKWKDKFVIDFGIMCPFMHEEIYCYFPFNLKKGKRMKKTQEVKWLDLGNSIANDNELLCSIFNEDKSASKVVNSCFYRISSSDTNPSNNSESVFYLYPLGENNVRFEETENGSLMRIKILNFEEFKNNHQIVDTQKIYIRFRIFVKDADGIRISRNLSNDLIQAPFTKKDIYDIKVNDTISLDKKIREKLRHDGFLLAKFSKSHIFYIASTNTVVGSESNLKLDSRIIERDVWKAYQPFNIHDSVYLAHHWKYSRFEHPKKISLSKVNLFFTAQYPKKQFGTIIAYIFMIIILGGVGSFLVSDNKAKKDFLDNTSYLITVAGMVCWILIWCIRSIRGKISLWFKEL